MKALVTGGCGFIGSHAVLGLLADGWQVTNLDKLTYASNLANLGEALEHSGHRLVEGDLCDTALVRELAEGADLVVNFAAETHVDRSLLDPGVFVRTDVEGVVSLLEAVKDQPKTALIHMSTDEVFGSLPEPQEAKEDWPFAPSSPYSASKAAAELMIRAYAETYSLPVTVIRCCNVYGPNQHMEKFIPLFAMRAMAGEPLPLYGDGRQQREWLYVDDFVDALRVIVRNLPATPGVQPVHVGSGERVPNIEVAQHICAFLERSADLIRPVMDRPGHDRRYAVDSSKLRAMGWAPQRRFEEGLEATVRWYAEHGNEWAVGAGGDFGGYFAKQYGERLR